MPPTWCVFTIHALPLHPAQAAGLPLAGTAWWVQKMLRWRNPSQARHAAFRSCGAGATDPRAALPAGTVGVGEQGESTPGDQGDRLWLFGALFLLCNVLFLKNAPFGFHALNVHWQGTVSGMCALASYLALLALLLFKLCEFVAGLLTKLRAYLRRV